MSLTDSSDLRFDEAFGKIEHLKRFPAMRPFVGLNYEDASHRRLLLVGESGYFPDESTCHKSAEDWYLLDQSSLSDEEETYLDWRALVGGEWNSAGHEMYRQINRFMREIIESDAPRAVSHIAYVNAFFRPASEPGESIKHSATSLDFEKGLDITLEIIDSLKADLVVFLSKFSWDTIGWRAAQARPALKMEFTAHAADRRWFNRKGYAHAKPKLMEFLRENFIKQTERK